MEENKTAKAYLRYVRIAPRKVQIVCDLIRGKDAKTAMAILMQTPKAASEPLVKLLKSACANAENNFNMDPEKLVVTQVFATPGPILKRMARIRSRYGIVCDLIRGKDAGTAMAILAQTPKAASEPLTKLLKSAVANAENNFGMDPAKLVVSEVFATPGPILKRMMPRAQGRAYRINKRTSHVTLAVTEKA